MSPRCVTHRGLFHLRVSTKMINFAVFKILKYFNSRFMAGGCEVTSHFFCLCWSLLLNLWVN
nr:MAG TPA: hypothetical protein [Caudoviricetes sp.]